MPFLSENAAREECNPLDTVTQIDSKIPEMLVSCCNNIAYVKVILSRPHEGHPRGFEQAIFDVMKRD